MYGYRCDEVGLKEPIHTLVLNRREKLPVYVEVVRKRFGAATQIGPIGCFCRPVADQNDSKLIAFGVMKRLFPVRFSRSVELEKEFLQYCYRIIDEEFPVCVVNNMKTWEEWLSSRDYNQARKNQLRQWREKFAYVPQVTNFDKVLKEVTHIKGFVKLEEYNEFKYPRNILPRHDIFKNLLGPTIEWAEHLLIQKPWVMKGQDVLLQPAIITDRLGAGVGIYYGTDFSHLEGSYKEFCYDLERYYLLHVAPWAMQEIDLLYMVTNTLQKVSIKDVRFKVDFVRCSGEMTTSVTHTLLNYLVNRFNAYKQGKNIIFIGTGDDGLFKSSGILNFDIIEKLGFEFKPELFKYAWEASFCHLYFNPYTNHLFRDPREFLVSVGWTLSSFRNTTSIQVLSGLFKAKLLSFLCLYSGCPIIGILCRHFLAQMGDVKAVMDIKSLSYWTRALTIDSQCSEELNITYSDRNFFAYIFNIDINTQIFIENEIMKMSPFQRYYPDVIVRFVEQHVKSSNWRKYYELYHHNLLEVGKFP